MRVVTTCHAAGLEEYGHRWLDSRKNWPEGTEFWFYTEGYELPADGMTVRDFAALEPFQAWKRKYRRYLPPDWQWDVVKYAHKVFAAADALYDYDGVGVWLDADCVTYAPLPEGLIEAQVKDVYLACYQRTGMYTETGMWVMNCAHPNHRAFLDAWREWYFSGRFKDLSQWHDCITLDATIRGFLKESAITVNNLSGEHHKSMHPQARTELGRYIDHAKGPRKAEGVSPENKFRVAA